MIPVGKAWARCSGRSVWHVARAALGETLRVSDGEVRWAMTSSPSFEAGDRGAGKMALEELVRAKRAHPVESVAELMEPDVFASDDEVDEFVAAVREWRQADLG